MKGLVTALIVALIALCALFLVASHRSDKELTKAHTDLDVRTTELESARAEVTTVRQTMQKNLNALETQVATLIKDKQTAEEKLAAVASDMTAVLGDLQTSKQQQEAMETKNLELAASLEGIRGELALAKKQNLQLEKEYGSLQKTHETTLNQFAEMRRDYVVVTKENEELESKLNDLDALKAQIRSVKVELREERIEEWKRSDRIAGAGGNRGYIMKNAKWQAVETSAGGSKYPLIKDIRREDDGSAE